MKESKFLDFILKGLKLMLILFNIKFFKNLNAQKLMLHCI